MSSLDRRPAIVGAAQAVQRVEDPHDALEPIALMEQALRRAAEDAGNGGLLGAIDAIYLPKGLWKYGNAGGLLAERVGAGKVATGHGELSGHIVQVMINRACSEIAAGKRDVVAIVGGESENSKRRLAKLDPEAIWDDETPGEPDVSFDSREMYLPPQEIAAQIFKATTGFAMCETSLRRARGETPAAHRARISRISARMSDVAAKNPYAWMQQPFTPEEIAEATPKNRLIAYPYTKLMTSNIAVDQAAAVIVCSAEAAKRFGLREDRFVHLRASTEMNYTTAFSERIDLHEHPGQMLAGQRILEILGRSAEDFEHIDLYSCFPLAVQAGAAAIGLDPDTERPLTVTGGLTFSGGPFGNYVVQSTARMVEVLREDPNALGLVGGVGGFFAKFSFGAYSMDPGDEAQPRIEDVSEDFAKTPLRPCAESFEGEAEIDAYTVDLEIPQAAAAIFSAINAGGERVWGRSDDPDLIAALVGDEDVAGRTALFREGRVTLS